MRGIVAYEIGLKAFLDVMLNMVLHWIYLGQWRRDHFGLLDQRI
jgi:hypothetical protein